MGARALKQDDYDRMLAAFRSEGVNYSAVAKAACIDPVTASKAYTVGWPRKGWKPIRTVLLEDGAAARAKAAAELAAKTAMKEKEQAEARKAAIESKTQEGQMVTFARQSSLRGLTVGNALMSSAQKLMVTIQPQLDIDIAKAPADQMPVGAKLGLLQRAVSITEAIIRTSMQAMQMERLHLGEPTDIIRRIDDAATGEMSTEMAELKIKAAQQAMESYKRSKLVLLQGGAANPMIGLNLGVDMNLSAAARGDKAAPAAAKEELDDDFEPIKKPAESA